MVKLPNKIKKLFYNPATDSIKILVENIKIIHSKIIKNTDLSKGTLPTKYENYISLIENFIILENGLSENKLSGIIANSFRGAQRWHSPRTMYNVAPSHLLEAVASSALTSLYNPNILWDTAAGEIAIVEQKVIKAMAEYIGWDWQKAGGSFVFGGEATKNGKKIATIIISGGTTNDMVVDPIKDVADLRDELVNKLGLDYRPHLHVDAVVGFPWIFFKDYNMEKNSLNMSEAAKERISKIVKNLRNLNYADSFGVDFHKMGFCPYISSLFMVKDKSSFYKDKDSLVEFGQYTPFAYTIENSRPGNGPMSAYIALNLLGVKGFQNIIAHNMEVAIDLQNSLEETGQFKIINKTGLGCATIFSPKIPEHIKFKNPEEEISVQNSYTTILIDTLRKMGNPFYLDMVPEYCTGATTCSHRALKAYIMSPYSSKETNSEFIFFMTDLKRKIDSKFDFSYRKNTSTEYSHPLK